MQIYVRIQKKYHHRKIMRCISINKYYKYFVHWHCSKSITSLGGCRGNHASICLRWLKLNQFLTLSSLSITIKQVLWWENFSDVKLRYVSLLDCYSLMAILECWPWLALVVVFIAYNWRSLLFLLPIITVKASGAPPFLETFKQINKVLHDKSLNL